MLSIFFVLLGLYILLCVLVYFLQEKLIFFPDKLPSDYQYQFPGSFKEEIIKTGDGSTLNALLFHASNPKGVILYLHGNAGSLDSWGMIASTYTSLGYDFFIPDYRGYGKSEGKISSEEQFFSDVQTVYDSLRSHYVESQIILIGYSIGSAAAARLASHNHPRMLILKAPYYSLIDLAKKTYPILPTFLLKYKFRTYQYLQQTAVPVVIFHGENDEVIYYGSSLKLQHYLKAGDKLITLTNQRHNGINENEEYQSELRKILF